MRSFYLLTGDDFSKGHPDDEGLYTRLSSEFKTEWLNWTQAENFQPEPGSTCLIRTPWEYQKNVTAFVSFLERLEQNDCKVWNPTDTVRWNIDKNYLLELAGVGVATVPTMMGSDYLRSSELGNNLVLKPRIGASGVGVQALSANEVTAYLQKQEMPQNYLVQEYQSSVESEGESSLIFFHFGGRPNFSHAVRKVPAKGDFRVQSSFGGMATADVPQSSVITWAEELLGIVEQRFGKKWIYSRVDILYKNNQPVLSELEMIEPELFNRFGPQSEDLLVRSILDRTLP